MQVCQRGSAGRVSAVAMKATTTVARFRCQRGCYGNARHQRYHQRAVRVQSCGAAMWTATRIVTTSARRVVFVIERFYVG